MHEYLLALIGGIFIGGAAVLILATHGKIMGVSGIVSRLLPPAAEDWLWRLAFVLGVLTAPLVFRLLGQLPDITVTKNLSLMLLGGLLVGFGTVTGSGCTSGHGVCGLPRLSRRSIVATVVFIAAGMLTVLLVRPYTGA